MWGNINGDGSFRFTAAAGPWSWSYCVNLGVVEVCFGASFASTITITSWSPYISIAASGSAWMDGHTLDCWWGGWHDTCLRCGWGGWGRWINAGLGFNTNPGNIWISLWGWNFSLR
jgi:hypothetical protein